MDYRAKGYFDKSQGHQDLTEAQAGFALGNADSMTVFDLLQLNEYCVERVNWYRSEKPGFTDDSVTKPPEFDVPLEPLLMYQRVTPCYHDRTVSQLVFTDAGVHEWVNACRNIVGFSNYASKYIRLSTISMQRTVAALMGKLKL